MLTIGVQSCLFYWQVYQIISSAHLLARSRKENQSSRFRSISNDSRSDKTLYMRAVTKSVLGKAIQKAVLEFAILCNNEQALQNGNICLCSQLAVPCDALSAWQFQSAQLMGVELQNYNLKYCGFRYFPVSINV